VGLFGGDGWEEGEGKRIMGGSIISKYIKSMYDEGIRKTTKTC
jgi:hypothetical protein